MFTNAAEVRHYLSEMLPKSELNLWLVCSGFRGAAFPTSLNYQTPFCETFQFISYCFGCFPGKVIGKEPKAMLP